MEPPGKPLIPFNRFNLQKGQGAIAEKVTGGYTCLQ